MKDFFKKIQQIFERNKFKQTKRNLKFRKAKRHSIGCEIKDLQKHIKNRAKKGYSHSNQFVICPESDLFYPAYLVSYNEQGILTDVAFRLFRIKTTGESYVEHLEDVDGYQAIRFTWNK